VNLAWLNPSRVSDALNRNWRASLVPIGQTLDSHGNFALSQVL
jgi:hypothetical protein